MQKVKGKSSEVKVGTIGLEILSADGTPVAAVSKIGEPQVHFNSTDPTEKFLLANTCTAIIL